MAEQADPGRPILAEAPAAAAPRIIWPIARPPAAWSAVVVAAVLALIEAALALRWLALPHGLAAVASAPLVIAGALSVSALAVHTWSCLTARFAIDATTLTIIRGTARWVVPLSSASIADAQPGAVLANRLLLPGIRAGTGYIKDGGPAVFLTTAPLAQSVIVRTPSSRLCDFAGPAGCLRGGD